MGNAKIFRKRSVLTGRIFVFLSKKFLFFGNMASRARWYTPCFFASISLRSISQKMLVGEGSPIPTERPRSGAAARPCGRFHAGLSPRRLHGQKPASRVKMNGLRPPLTRFPDRTVLQPRRESLIRLFLRQKPLAGGRKEAHYLFY